MCVGGFYVVRLLFCLVVSCCYRGCCCCCLQTTRGLLHEASITGDCDTARKLLEIGVDVDDRDQVVIYFFVHSFKICLFISIYLSTLLLSIPFLPFLLLRVGEWWEGPSFMAISLCLTYFVDFVRKGHFTIVGFNTLVLPYPSSECESEVS